MIRLHLRRKADTTPPVVALEAATAALIAHTDRLLGAAAPLGGQLAVTWVDGIPVATYRLHREA